MQVITLFLLSWSAAAVSSGCPDGLAVDQVYAEKFRDLVENGSGFYVRGTNYILRHAVYRPVEEESRLMTPDQAAGLLANFDRDGRFTRDGVPQNGLFSFSLTDDRRLYLFRPGARALDETSIRHTFPVHAAALAAVGEMLFDQDGLLIAVNPFTGHYLIDPDLSNHQLRRELERRDLNHDRIRFFPWAFPAELMSHHSVGR